MTRKRIVELAMLAVLAGCVTLLGATPATRPAAAPPTSQPVKVTLEQTVRAQMTAILDELANSGNFNDAQSKADAFLDQVAAQGTDKTLAAFRDAAFVHRLVHQLSTAPADKRMDLLKYLREHDTLARTMAFMISGGGGGKKNSEAAPYGVLLQLKDKFGDQVDKYANLTTALCVVHDRPFQRHINENLTTAPSPTELFEYYTTNEKAMFFGIKNVPPELLIYVVDTTAPIEEMTWAMKKYAGDNAIGRHFFDIAYDYSAFKKGTTKQVDKEGYTLQNILKYGGICADQAFFATELGKSIGVPTAYTTGNSASAGHAWVGFLQERNGEGVWNFDEGRYAAYRGVKGNVVDPQTRQAIPDSYVSLLAELIGTRSRKLSADDRHAAIALTDAAIRAGELEGGTFHPAAMDPKPVDSRATPRAAGVDGALELLKMSVLQNKGYPQSWYVVWNMTKDGKLSMAQKKEWRDAVLAVCGTKYPDFAMTILVPIIATVEDPVQQNQWWDAVFTMFQGRADLCAAIRMHQAKLWEDKNQQAKAGQYYEDVINRFTNAGPFVIAALVGAEKLLDGKPDKVLKLYETTFAKAERPQQSAFMDQSNWFRIGKAYEAKLRDAGKTKEADTLETQLGGKQQ